MSDVKKVDYDTIEIHFKGGTIITSSGGGETKRSDGSTSPISFVGFQETKVPVEIGKDMLNELDGVGSRVRMVFNNVGSIDVVMKALTKARDRLLYSANGSATP